MFALALLSALTGCVNAPPTGPLVEYRPGEVPVTRPVKCPATYILTSTDQPTGEPPLAAHRVSKGEWLGFRTGEDGSAVAVAPGYTLPLLPGAYRWEVVRGSVPTWRERLWCEVRGRAAPAVGTAALVVGVCGVSAIGPTLVLAYLWAKKYDNTHAHPNPTRPSAPEARQVRRPPGGPRNENPAPLTV
jgi:hypothetical protein